MRATRTLRSVVDRRTLAGLAGAAVLAVVFAVLNRPLFEWFVAQSPDPKHAGRTGNQLTFWWATGYFTVSYLLPVAAAYVGGNDLKRGLLGVLVYGATWRVVSPAVPTGPSAEVLVVWAVVLGLLGGLFGRIAGQDITMFEYDEI